VSTEKSTSKRKGRYAALHGDLWRHPKVAGGPHKGKVYEPLSLAARGLWASLLSYAIDQETDGRVSSTTVVLVAASCSPKDRASALAELETNDLVVDSAIHGFADSNITAAEWADSKAADAEKKRLKRAEEAAKREATSAGRPSDVLKTSEGRRQDKPKTADGVSRAKTEDIRPKTSERGGEGADAPAPPVPSDVEVHPRPVPVVAPAQAAPMAPVDPGEALVERAASKASMATRLIGLYAKAYEGAFRDLWQGHSAARSAIDETAAWCLSQPDPEVAAVRCVEGAYSTARLLKHRVPWAWIAEDPAKYAASSTRPSTGGPPSKPAHELIPEADRSPLTPAEKAQLEAMGG